MLDRSARDPVSRISDNIEKGCYESIKFLLALRQEIKATPMTVENPDPDFAELYRQGNDTEAHWMAMTRLLKRGGYTEIDVRSACMDLIGEAYAANKNETRTDAQKRLVSLVDSAVKNVFM